MISRQKFDGAAVKEAAYACGFTELGRFSGYYRELFGEKPNEALKGKAGG